MRHTILILAAMVLIGCSYKAPPPEQTIITFPPETEASVEPLPWEEEAAEATPEPESNRRPPEDTRYDSPARMGSPPPAATEERSPSMVGGAIDWFINDHPLGLGRSTPPVESSEPEGLVVDDVLDQLAEASLAFVMPDRANVKSRVRAQLLISIRAMEQELTEELTVEGQEFTGRVLVSRVVLAKLTAPAFEVETITSERQAVSQTAATEWLWYLTPKKTGTHEVFLTITAFVYADEANYVERHIRTFEKVIYVDVLPQQMVEAWLAKYWQWFFTVLLLPVLRYLWKRYKK